MNTTHNCVQVDSRSEITKKSISNFGHSKRDPSKSSNDSLSSADTIISIPRHLARPTSPPPPPIPERNKSHEFEQPELEISVFDTSASSKTEDKTDQSTTTTHRKSVSFDLSDNEYIPVLSNEPEPSDNVGELFLRQFSEESAHEDNDGYEIPFKYPLGPRTRQPKQVKSILRSPSPNSSAKSVTTTLSSLDRPLRTTRIETTNIPSVTAVIVHTTNDEIERENPFRKEFLERRPNENIYEELDFEVQTTQKPSQPSEFQPFKKQRPKSAYTADDTREYTELLSKACQSNENLSGEIVESKLLVSQPVNKSTGNLVTERPKQKPPLPPKPSTSIKSPPSVVKHANIMRNEALKAFQEEMLHGDLYEFVHDVETNKIIKIKQQSSSIPIAKLKADENTSNERDIETRLTTFNPSNPLPPIPKSNQNIPPYSKVMKRGTSVERPSESPPPPPINLSTLPNVDKLKYTVNKF